MLKRALHILIYSLLFASTAIAQEADFQQLVTPLRNFRNGTGKGIAIRVATSSFKVLRLRETQVKPELAQRLLPKTPIFPRLKITASGMWIAHEISADTVLEQPLPKSNEKQTSNWKRKDWVALGTYPNTTWDTFVQFLVSQGLTAIREEQYGNNSTYALSFAPIPKTSISAGSRSLGLSSAFNSHMRISPEFPARAGTSGFVVLLHDPHENVAGRFETLAGLKALIGANPSISFKFLVEGAYSDTSRNIGLAGLDTVVKSAGEHGANVVHSLLRTYLIDTPMAYRLLYDPARKIEAQAIDNNELLNYPAPPESRSREAQVKSLQGMVGAIDKSRLSKEDKESVTEILGLPLVFLTADLRDVPDEGLIKYFETLGELYDSIASTGKLLTKEGVAVNSSDIQSLTADAKYYKAEAAVYRKALERNKTMVPFLIKGGQTPNQVPIAFIGSYHTSGMTRDLTAANVGYVVIEPRPRSISTENESRLFNKANHSEGRDAYLASTTLNKGWVAPTTREVREQSVPKISLKLPTAKTERAAAATEFSKISGSNVDVSRLFSAVDESGSLAIAQVSGGGNRAPPPTKFRQAFAYFDPGDGPGARGKPQLVVIDPKDTRWKEGDRYDYLRHTVLFTPTVEREVKSGVAVDFYHGGNRLFVAFYDPQSKRTYWMESDPNKPIRLVPIPVGANGKEQNIRAQIVLLARGHKKNG